MVFKIDVFFASLKEEIPNKNVSEILGSLPFKTFSSILRMFLKKINLCSSTEMCQYNFFQRKVVLIVICLFNHDSSKSTIFMLNMAFDVLLSVIFVCS